MCRDDFVAKQNVRSRQRLQSVAPDNTRGLTQYVAQMLPVHDALYHTDFFFDADACGSQLQYNNFDCFVRELTRPSIRNVMICANLMTFNPRTAATMNLLLLQLVRPQTRGCTKWLQ